MARRKMKDRKVHMDRSYTYQLDNARRRTLPPGWRGTVPGEVAKEIVRLKTGRIIDEPAAETTSGDGDTAKSGGTEGDAATGGNAPTSGGA